MGRRQFKLEAIRLVKERGVAVTQASRDLDIGENVLRRWIKEAGADPGQAFPGQGPTQAGAVGDRSAAARGRQAQTERDILEKAAAYFARESL